MKRALATVVFLLAATGVFAISAKVVDADGQATARTMSGRAEKVAIGRTYTTGDSIRTGKDGLVELSHEGLTVRVGPSTVFTLMERESGGKPTGMLAVTLGSVKMKYERLTGAEPLIQSVGCIAGVRGTELTVWAGSDGASRFIVDSGLVSVEASGKTVDLGPEEAVDVVNGQPPGEKFVVPRERIDYRTWESQRIAALVVHPLETVDGMRARLEYYLASAQEYADLFAQFNARLKEQNARVTAIKAEQGEPAAQRFVAEVLDPLRVQTGNLFLNYRYHVLAAVSLRRFIGARVYLLVKVEQFADPDNPEFARFLDRYREFLDLYEAKLVPLASERDFY